MGYFSELAIGLPATVPTAEKLTYEDLRIIYATHGEDRSVYDKTDGVRSLVKFDYRKGFLTPVGDIEQNKWYELAEKLITLNYEGWITDSLQEWFQLHHPSCKGKDEKTARYFALKSHIHRDFDRERWIYYIPWNRKYRSEVLAGRLFPTVLAPCCNVPGETTIAQLQLHIENREIRGYCPHCFQSSSLTIVNDPCGSRRLLMKKELEDAG